MNTAKKIYQSDGQGMVHLDLPVGKPDLAIEVIVVWQEMPSKPEETSAHSEDWSDLFGLLKEDPLERPSPGEYERREPLL